jgi:DNA replication and repair protein RecF
MSFEYIALKNFRNHEQKIFETKNNPSIVGFIGKNGSGKTSILEALSLIDGSNGIRNAKTAEMSNSSSDGEFEVGVKIGQKHITIESKTARKIIKINKEYIKKTSNLPQIINIIWTSSEIEYLFFSSNSTKRDYFDRSCNLYIQNHSSTLAEIKKLCSERLIALSELKPDYNYISKTEELIALKSEIICKNRELFCQKLNNFIPTSKSTLLEQILIQNENNIVRIPEQYKAELSKNRNLDLHLNRTKTSINKLLVDIKVKNKDQSIKQFSSGENKAILIDLCFTIAEMIKSSYAGREIILIFDDIFAKLDTNTSMSLIDKMVEFKTGTTFYSSTESITKHQNLHESCIEFNC